MRVNKIPGGNLARDPNISIPTTRGRCTFPWHARHLARPGASQEVCDLFGAGVGRLAEWCGQYLHKGTGVW